MNITTHPKIITYTRTTKKNSDYHHQITFINQSPWHIDLSCIIEIGIYMKDPNLDIQYFDGDIDFSTGDIIKFTHQNNYFIGEIHLYNPKQKLRKNGFLTFEWRSKNELTQSIINEINTNSYLLIAV